MSSQPRFRVPARASSLATTRRRRATRRTIRPSELPLRAADEAAYPHMLYARTVPLIARDQVATRRRTVLSEVTAALDNLVVDPDRPFSLWRLLDRAGFVPTTDADITPLATLLHEMALTLSWREIERHAAPGTDELATTVRWPRSDLRVVPKESAQLLRVRVAGNGLQLAVYGAETN